MKTLTKLFTTVLTIGLLANTAQANSKICEENSEAITEAYKATSKIVEGGSFDKSSTIDLLRDTLIKQFKILFKGHKLQVGLIMNNYALDYVDENYEKMKLMTNAEIKRIGYITCSDVEKKIKKYYRLNSNK